MAPLEKTESDASQPLILLVDDDPNDALLAQMALKRAGGLDRIVHLPDGDHAIRYLAGVEPYQDRAANPLPSLMILDLKMPKLSGFDVLAWMKGRPELSKKVPVVVLSGSILEQDEKDAKDLGASGFEIKPVDFAEMIRIVKRVQQKWLKVKTE